VIPNPKQILAIRTGLTDNPFHTVYMEVNVSQLAPTIQRTPMPRPAEPVAIDIAEALAGSPATDAPPLSRDCILDAAAACLDDGGYESLTIRNLARRLDCAVGSIYRYFSDKHELLVECGVRLMRPVLDALDGPDADFHRSVDRYFAAAESDPQLYQLMFWLPRRAGQSGVPEVIDRIINRWSALLGDGIEARRRFAAIHGQITLGEAAGIAIEIEELDSSSPSQTPSPSTEDVTLL